MPSPPPPQFWKGKHSNHIHTLFRGPKGQAKVHSPRQSRGTGQEQVGTSPQSEKRAKGLSIMRTRSGLGRSAPPHKPRPVFLTSSGSSSEQANMRILPHSGPATPPSTFPKDMSPWALNGFGGKSCWGWCQHQRARCSLACASLHRWRDPGKVAEG